MHQDNTAQAEQKKDEREKVLKEIRQLENRQKILQNRQRNEERKARTRRLIERGAILEGVFPLAPALSGEEVKTFLVALSRLPGAEKTGRRTAEVRGQAVSPLLARAHLCTVAGAVRASSQSPLVSVSALRRKLRPLPCSSFPHENRSAGFSRGPHERAVALSERDGELHSPNPLCAPRSQTPASRLSGSTEPEYPSPKGGDTHRFLPYPRQYHQAQRGPFRCCRSRLPQRNQADE